MESGSQLVIAIELGNDRVEELVANQQDSPRLLAQHFCIKNDLSAKAQLALSQFLQAQMKVLGQPVDSPAGKPATSRFGYSNLQAVRRRLQRDQVKAPRASLMQLVQSHKNQRTHALIQKGIDHERAMHEKRLEREQAQLAQCTFAPVINENSRKLLSSKRSRRKFAKPERASRQLTPQAKLTSRLSTTLAAHLYRRFSEGRPGARPLAKVLEPFFRGVSARASFRRFRERLESFFNELSGEDQSLVLRANQSIS